MPENFLHGVEVLEVTDGPRPITSVSSSVVGLVGGAEGQQLDGAKATISLGTGNSGIKFEAKVKGVAGNAITVSIAKASSPSQPLAITVSGPTIGVVLATDGANAATTTVAQLITAINAHGGASALVLASLAAGSSGVGVLANHSATALAGGVNPSFPLDEPVLVLSARDLDTKLSPTGWLNKAIKAVFRQGNTIVVAVLSSQGGDLSDLTGAYALLKSQTSLGYTPRIFCVEGSYDDGYPAIVKEVADKLRAITVIGLPSGHASGDWDTPTEATAWAAANGNQRTYCVWPFVNGGEDPAPYVAGRIARTDNDLGFWWSPSNQEVFGISSLDSPVDFELGDATSTANVLNEGNVATFIRQNGFRLWGNRVPAADVRYQFLSVRRTADLIQDSVKRAHLWAVDRSISRTYLDDVAEGVSDYLRRLTNLGAILGGSCWPDPDLNTPSSIQSGQVYFNFDFTPPFPAERVTFRALLVNDYVQEIL